MKRKFTFLIAAAVMLLTMGATTGEMWGQIRTEEVAYTLQPASGSNNSYAGNCDITINGITWNLTGNSQQIPWRIGGKSLSGVDRTLYSKTAISDNISKIEVTHGAASGITINSWTVIVSKNSDFSNPVSTLTPSFAANSATTINRPDGKDWSNCYYKFVYNVTVSGNSNKFLEFSQAKFYKEDGGGNPSISADNIEIAYNATAGEIAYTINNPVQGGQLTAATESDWISNITVGETVTFTCSANPTYFARMATVTLTYTYNTDETVNKNVTVTQALNPEGPGSLANPFTIEQAREFIDGLGGGTSSEVHVGGMISQIDSYNSGYHSITYWISDDGTTTNQLEVFGGKGLNGADFNSVEDLVLQSEVVVKGTLKKYNDIYEFNSNSQIVSLTPPAVPTITAENVNIAYNATAGEIVYTINNQVEGGQLSAATESDWLALSNNFASPIAFTCSANEGANARTATVTLTYTYNRANVTKNVTVTQAEYIVPTYAELPFSFNGGRTDIEDTDGLYQDGLGSDYSGSTSPNTKLKFDSTNDWLLLQFNERPGTLTFSIKNNSFSEGTFKLQTSIDGTTFVDLKTYTDAVLIGTLDEEFTELNENVRYIKWVYTDRQSGNIGLGNISLTKYVEPAASITITPELVDATIAETEGYLGIAYVALNITQADDFGIQFYDNNSQELNGNDEPNWIQAEAATQIGQEGYFVYYVISANTGAARSAYFKVYAFDNNAELVYSNLVTVNQAAVPSPVINAEDIEIGYDATSGEIAYTITNPTTATLTATSTEEWISNITVTTDKVTFSSTINEGNTDRIGTITLSYEGAENKAVTITQGHQAVDYAILPFEWAGGSSTDFAALNGVTLSGNGSDYGNNNAPYLIKFDNDNDYIMVKTDCQPAKVNIGVKMIGGASTSTITVKASTDGETFDDGEELTISGKQNDVLNLETTRTFDADVRYVKMVFTKGSNVGVGPITITKYTTDPIINAEDVDLACDATSGEIAYTITNPATGVSLGATTTADWISNVTITEEKVTFTTTANESTTARTATFTLTYTGAENKTVTVTQGAIDYATMPFAFDKGRNDIENTAGLTQDGLDTDYSSSPKLKFNTAGDWIILKLNAAPVSLSYDIKGNDFSGGTFTVQVSANGSSYTDIETYTSLGDTQTITLLNSDDNVRYIKWVYTKKVNGNVALGNLNVTTELIINGDCTVDNITISNTEVLTIEAGSVMTITGTLTNEGDASNLIIEDGGQLIHNGNVTATLKKNVAGYNTRSVSGWYTIASPVANMDVNCATTGTYDFFAFNEENTKWLNQKVAANNITNFEQGVGYLYANADATVVNYLGTLIGTETEVTKPLSYACENASYQGINLMGNPFSRNLVAGDIEIAGTSLTTYYTVEGGNELTAKTLASTPIKPGQGFMVQATASSQNLVFNPTSKDRSTAKVGYISIVAGNSEFTDNAFVQVGGGNTLHKMTLSDNSSIVYVMNNGNDYAAATIDALEGSMPVCFKANALGSYTITIEAIDINADYLHLIDNFTGEDINLLLEPSYSFIASNGDRAERFTLVFRSNGCEGTTNDIFAFQNGSDIVVNGEGELQVFDVTGRMVATQHVNGVQTVNVPSQGVFIFKLNEKTQKIVVR